MFVLALAFRSVRIAVPLAATFFAQDSEPKAFDLEGRSRRGFQKTLCIMGSSCFGDLLGFRQMSSSANRNAKLADWSEPTPLAPSLWDDPSFDNPDPWADPKSRSTLGFYNLQRRSTGVQNWWIYFLDPPGGLGRIPIM